MLGPEYRVSSNKQIYLFRQGAGVGMLPPLIHVGTPPGGCTRTTCSGHSLQLTGRDTKCGYFDCHGDWQEGSDSDSDDDDASSDDKAMGSTQKIIRAIRSSTSISRYDACALAAGPQVRLLQMADAAPWPYSKGFVLKDVIIQRERVDMHLKDNNVLVVQFHHNPRDKIPFPYETLEEVTTVEEYTIKRSALSFLARGTWHEMVILALRSAQYLDRQDNVHRFVFNLGRTAPWPIEERVPLTVTIFVYGMYIRVEVLELEETHNRSPPEVERVDVVRISPRTVKARCGTRLWS